MFTVQAPRHARHNQKLHLLAVGVLAGALLLLNACGSEAAEARDAGGGRKLTVGSDLTAPPYASLDGDEPVGFDPEMVKALAEQMGDEITVKDIRFEQLIPSLQSGQIDLIASDLYITAERAKVVDYVPYFSTGNSIMTNSGAPPIKDPMGLCGKRVAVIKGGEVVNRLRGPASDDCRAADQRRIDVREFATDPEGTQALIAGQVDAQVTDGAISASIAKSSGGRVVVTSSELIYTVPVGLAVKKGNDALRKRVERALEQLKQSGAYDDLLRRYNLAPVDENQVSSILGTP